MRSRFTNTSYTTWRTHLVKQRPLCQNRCSAITAQVCTAICLCPRTVITCSLATNTAACLKSPCSTSAVSSNMRKPLMPWLTRPPTPTSVWSQVMKHRSCWHIQPVTVQLLSVFLLLPARKLAVLKRVSPILRLTRTCASPRC